MPDFLVVVSSAEWAWAQLARQCIELFSERELHFFCDGPLTFTDHVLQFNTGQRAAGGYARNKQSFSFQRPVDGKGWSYLAHNSPSLRSVPDPLQTIITIGYGGIIRGDWRVEIKPAPNKQRPLSRPTLLNLWGG
ncbi:MAG: hypothetical protein Q7W05_06965 [Deltaproteobacteria bacterium]|jgi:hypothetical protein|nr:hypothetical protein [Deltaproteobacteria bacterium]